MNPDTQTLILSPDWTAHYRRYTPRDRGRTAARRALAAELAAIHRAEPFGGPIAVRYLADPDPVETWLAQAETVHLVTLRTADGTLAGFGTCLERPSRVNGAPATVGYLAGLKLLPAYRGHFRHIAALYRWMHTLTRARITHYYTTILTANTAAIDLLTKRRRSMPHYIHQGRYTVYALKPLRAPREAPPAPPAPPAGSLAFAPEPRPLMDLRSVRQYVVAHYEGPLRLLRHFPTALLGYPAFPRPGVPIAWIAGHLRLTADTPPAEARARLAALRAGAHARGADLLLLGAVTGTPTARFLDRTRAVRYTSELYLIDWTHDGVDPLTDIDLPVAVL